MYDNNNQQYKPPYPQPMNQQPYYPQQQYYQPQNVYYSPIPMQWNPQIQYMQNQPIIPLEPLKNERKSIRHYYNWCGACLLFFLLFATVFYLVPSSIIGDIREGSIADELLSCISMTASFLLSVLICCLATRTSLKKLFNWRDVKLSTIGKIAVADQGTLLIALVVVCLIQGLFSVLGISEQLPDTKIDPGIATVIDIIYGCIGAPILEEIMFRGFILRNLSRVSLRFGIFASAFLFGLTHGNTQQFLIAGIGGIFYAYIAIKTNSIFPSIICHSIYNTLVTLSDQLIQKSENIGNIIFYSWFGLMTVLGIIIVIVSRKKINFPKTTIEKRKRCLPIFLSSPTVIISIVVIILMSIYNNFSFIK